MKIILKLIIVILILIGSTGINTFALDCPTGGNWSQRTLTQQMGIYPGSGTVTVNYRQADGVNYDMFFDWSTFSNNVNYMDDSTMKKLLAMQIGEVGAQNLNGYTWQLTVYYKTDCYVTLSSYFRTSQATEITCDNGDPAIANSFLNYDGIWYFVVKQDKKCGEKCCKKVYTCTRHQGVDDQGHTIYYTTLSNPTTYSVSVESCGSPSQYIDCKTLQSIPCGSGGCN